MHGLVVFGRTGQVARELEILAPNARFIGREQIDLSDPSTCASAIIGATAVINAAAYTAVDQAEAEPDIAYTINSAAPAAMAQACRGSKIPFLHISTDYVFDGSGDTARDEIAVADPLNIYGASKLAGERAVVEQGGQWVILRTSWVFSAHGSNFFKTMRRLGFDHDHLSVVDDQFGGPTAASDIAAALLSMTKAMQADPNISGIYHFSGHPIVSWADFAEQIFLNTGQPCQVRRISTSDYPTPAKRPLNSRLNCSCIERDFKIKQPDWRQSLIKILNQQE